MGHRLFSGNLSLWVERGEDLDAITRQEVLTGTLLFFLEALADFGLNQAHKGRGLTISQLTARDDFDRLGRQLFKLLHTDVTAIAQHT